MALSAGYELATDVQFRELSNYATPPRAGKITAIEGSGQVRVDTDDPDGGDVLAWPLNGLTYAVDDVVYVAFAVNHPESALVIGSKGSDPSGGPFIRKSGVDALTGDWDIGEDRKISLEKMWARDSEGLTIADDAGTQAVFVRDGSIVMIGPGTPINDGNVRLQLSTGGSDTEANFGINKNGAYGFLFGYRNQRVWGGINGNVAFSGSYYRNVTSDPLIILVNNINAAGMFLSNGDVGLGGVITSTSTLAGATLRLVSGDVGIGVAPIGKIHAVDGAGYLLFVTMTAVTGTAQTVIANGSGDVTRALFGWFVLNDGTSGLTNSFSMLPGDNVDISLGGSTWRLALNANGELTAQRTSGSGTATIALLMMWI